MGICMDAGQAVQNGIEGKAGGGRIAGGWRLEVGRQEVYRRAMAP